MAISEFGESYLTDKANELRGQRLHFRDDPRLGPADYMLNRMRQNCNTDATRQSQSSMLSPRLWMITTHVGRVMDTLLASPVSAAQLMTTSRIDKLHEAEVSSYTGGESNSRQPSTQFDRVSQS